jgi:hypothetical protein
LPVPQNPIFTVTVSNMSPGVEPGVDMFQLPAAGYSDPTFMLAPSHEMYSEPGTNNEKRLSG